MEHIVHEQNLEIRRLNNMLNRLQGENHDQNVAEEKRVALLAEITKYEESIENLNVSLAKAQRLMFSALNDEERNVVRLRCYKQYPWDTVAKKAAMSRSSCFRVYMGAMGNLCMAWEKEEVV